MTPFPTATATSTYPPSAPPRATKGAAWSAKHLPERYGHSARQQKIRTRDGEQIYLRIYRPWLALGRRGGDKPPILSLTHRGWRLGRGARMSPRRSSFSVRCRSGCPGLVAIAVAYGLAPEHQLLSGCSGGGPEVRRGILVAMRRISSWRVVAQRPI